MKEWLSDPLILNLIVTAIGALFVLLGGREWLEKKKQKRYGKAVELVEQGVYETYNEFVKNWKSQDGGRKLTKEEREIAFRNAKLTAIEYGTNHGVDILKEIGKDALPRLVETIVNRTKSGTAAKLKVELPKLLTQKASQD